MSPATMSTAASSSGGHDLLQPARVRAEVERRDGRALADQRPDRPGPDAAHRPGDQEPLAGGHDATPAGGQRGHALVAAGVAQPADALDRDGDDVAVGQQHRRVAEDARPRPACRSR